MSNTQATQVKITLPNELYLHLRSRAEKFGLNLAAYVRNLIINDVKDIDIPVFKMSEKTEKVVSKALEDYKSGKTKEIGNIDNYLNNL
jgi:predicted DNA-binding protein